MVRAIILATALALLAGDARAQLDLTPTDSFYEIEGIRVANVTLRDGAKDVTYTPPAGWKLNGGRNRLMLAPPDAVQAGAVMQVVVAKEALLPATTGNLQAYSDLALQIVPREAAKVEIVEAIICPLRISGRPLVEVTLNYVLFGQQFRTNLLFLPRDRDQLRLQFSSRISDYPPLLKAFRSSLYSMQGL